MGTRLRCQSLHAAQKNATSLLQRPYLHIATTLTYLHPKSSTEIFFQRLGYICISLFLPILSLYPLSSFDDFVLLLTMTCNIRQCTIIFAFQTVCLWGQTVQVSDCKFDPTPAETIYNQKNAVFKAFIEPSAGIIASFPGPAQLSVPCSTEKRGEPGIFSLLLCLCNLLY